MGWVSKYYRKASVEIDTLPGRAAAGQLADLTRELDRLDGGHYPNRDLDQEAENALAGAQSHVEAALGARRCDRSLRHLG